MYSAVFHHDDCVWMKKMNYMACQHMSVTVHTSCSEPTISTGTVFAETVAFYALQLTFSSVEPSKCQENGVLTFSKTYTKTVAENSGMLGNGKRLRQYFQYSALSHRCVLRSNLHWLCFALVHSIYI